MKKTRERKEEQGTVWLSVMTDILLGGAAALAAVLLLLAAAAALISAGLVSDGQMDNAVTGACLLGALAGGLFAVRRAGTKTLLLGLGTGAVLFLFLLSAGFLLYGAPAVEKQGISAACACLCGGAIAGILGGRPRKKQREKRRR